MEEAYPSGSTTKKTHIFVCVFPNKVGTKASCSNDVTLNKAMFLNITFDNLIIFSILPPPPKKEKKKKKKIWVKGSASV